MTALLTAYIAHCMYGVAELKTDRDKYVLHLNRDCCNPVHDTPFVVACIVNGVEEMLTDALTCGQQFIASFLLDPPLISKIIVSAAARLQRRKFTLSFLRYCTIGINYIIRMISSIFCI
jgi:hypothetical protein